MSQTGPWRQASDLLYFLKKRSGYSYEWLSRRTFISRSAIHRYCSGESIPPAFGVIEKLAKACGASREEISSLYRLWERDRARRDRGPVPLSGSADRPPSSRVVPQAEADPAQARPVRPNKIMTLFSAASVVVLVLALASSSKAPVRGAADVARTISAPAWAQTPTPISGDFFGVTMNSSTGAMPTFRIGALRLWDSRTRWTNLQPSRDHFDWSILDRLVASAGRAGMPVLFTFGGVPPWASPGGARAAYDDGSRSSPPDDLADWDTFVTKLTSRYRGRIQAYEIWVMGNHPRLYSGSVETLYEMTRRASTIIKRVDPKAITVCPGMGQLWSPAGQQILQRFTTLGGFDHCDAASVKLHAKQASEPPETMLELVAAIHRVFHRAGAHPLIWSTGTTYDITLQGRLDRQTAADFAARFYLVGLYARYQRMFFYNWGADTIPIVLQAEGTPPTQAALYVEEMQRWLQGASIRACSQGIPANLPANVWQCQFVTSRATGAKEFVIRWTHSGTAHIRVEPGITTVHHLNGRTARTKPGDDLLISTSPVLLR